MDHQIREQAVLGLPGQGEQRYWGWGWGAGWTREVGGAPRFPGRILGQWDDGELVLHPTTPSFISSVNGMGRSSLLPFAK